jgi:kynurenine 3-monooxygenase
MAGPLSAILLARRGFLVTLYERRSIERLNRIESGRSFNLTLTQRGLAAFRKIGLEDQVKSITQPLIGRTTHVSGNASVMVAYGKQSDEALYSVRRSELNRLLIESAASESRVVVRGQTEFLDFGSSSGALVIKDLKQDEVFSDNVDYLIGADGIHSRVRNTLHRGRPADLKREYFDWAYKEFSISSEESLSLGLRHDQLHVWPSGGILLIAIPNRDGSMTGDVMFPRGEERGLENLTTAQAWDKLIFFRFPALAQKVRGLNGDALSRTRSGYLQTLSTSVWTDSTRTVLIGDAAHGVFPFYGQGMNSALEDSVILDRLIGESAGDLPQAFTRFERERKVDTDALCELSRQHFYELRKGGNRKPILSHLFEFESRGSIYSLVAHTTRPYREALREWKRQRQMARVAAWAIVPLTALVIAILLMHHPWQAVSALNSTTATEVNHES